MTFTEIDQALKDEGNRAKVRVAMVRWAVARLQNASRNAVQDGFAQTILRTQAAGWESVTVLATMLCHPTFNETALADDAAMQTSVNTFVPAMLAANVIIAEPFTTNP